jgi:hypothetical protein
MVRSAWYCCDVRPFWRVLASLKERMFQMELKVSEGLMVDMPASLRLPLGKLSLSHWPAPFCRWPLATYKNSPQLVVIPDQ